MSEVRKALEIIAVYPEPNSIIDEGNLYFAATELQKEYHNLQSQLAAKDEEIERLKLVEIVGRDNQINAKFAEIDKLLKQLKAMTELAAENDDAAGKAQKECDQIREENKTLREGLKFYADENNWVAKHPDKISNNTFDRQDAEVEFGPCGKLARETLAKVSKG